jgi:hypothetical protein
VQNDTLLALLMDPFLTFEEAAKEFGAISPLTRIPSPALPKATAPNRLPGAGRRPARSQVSGDPVLHHPPSTAG